jgi:hypothetical protein
MKSITEPQIRALEAQGEKMKESGKEKDKMEIKGQNKCKIGKI